MKTVVIEAQARDSVGKKDAAHLRRAGHVPCVLYGDKQACVHFHAHKNSFKDIIFSPDFVTAEVKVSGNSYNAFIKAAQYNPVTDELQHVDFQLLQPNHPVVIELPLKLQGLAVGVQAGGKLLQKVRRLKVKAMPEKLIAEIKVDVSKLEVGKSIRVRDLELTGIEVLVPPATPLASVEITRALRAAAAAAAAAATSAGKKKK